MIYVACGLILMALGICWMVVPAKRPCRFYGYLSYLATVNNHSFKYAQKQAAKYNLLFGAIQAILGLLIHWLGWDRYFIIWLITFVFFIILPFVYTEKALKKYLLARHELPADYVEPDQIKHKKVKGFKDL